MCRRNLCILTVISGLSYKSCSRVVSCQQYRALLSFSLCFVEHFFTPPCHCTWRACAPPHPLPPIGYRGNMDRKGQVDLWRTKGWGTKSKKRKRIQYMTKIAGRSAHKHIYHSTAARNSGVNRNQSGQLHLQKAHGSFLITEYIAFLEFSLRISCNSLHPITKNKSLPLVPQHVFMVCYLSRHPIQCFANRIQSTS